MRERRIKMYNRGAMISLIVLAGVLPTLTGCDSGDAPVNDFKQENDPMPKGVQTSMGILTVNGT